MTKYQLDKWFNYLSTVAYIQKEKINLFRADSYWTTCFRHIPSFIPKKWNEGKSSQLHYNAEGYGLLVAVLVFHFRDSNHLIALSFPVLELRCFPVSHFRIEEIPQNLVCNSLWWDKCLDWTFPVSVMNLFVVAPQHRPASCPTFLHFISLQLIHPALHSTSPSSGFNYSSEGIQTSLQSFSVFSSCLPLFRVIWEWRRRWTADLSSHSCVFVSVGRSLHIPHKNPHRLMCVLGKQSSCLSPYPGADTSTTALLSVQTLRLLCIASVSRTWLDQAMPKIK